MNDTVVMNDVVMNDIVMNEFPAILLKQCSKNLAHPLQLLYKTSLKTGEIRTDLKGTVQVQKKCLLLFVVWQ